MISRKALLVSLPVALAGGAVALTSTQRVEWLRGELRAATTQGKREGESFVATLRGSHAERELEALDRRRAIAAELAAAYRNRLLGLLALVAAALLFAGAQAAARISAELTEDRASFADELERRPKGGEGD
jgi:hypothetical protein